MNTMVGIKILVVSANGLTTETLVLVDIVGVVVGLMTIAALCIIIIILVVHYVTTIRKPASAR